MSAPKTITHLLPTGAIILWGGADMPSGFLLCNGAEVHTSDYPELAAALDAEGDTFALPDYRGRVPQGADSTNSPGVGISAGLPEIFGNCPHDFYATGSASSSGDMFIMNLKEERLIPFTGTAVSASYAMRVDFSAYNSIFGASSSVQPPALAQYFIIKC